MERHERVRPLPEDSQHPVPLADAPVSRSEDCAPNPLSVNPYWLQPDVSFHWDERIAQAEFKMLQGRMSNWGTLEFALAYGPILDVGCGHPRFTSLASDWPWIYTDIVPREPGIIQALASELPFKDGTFSQVIACRVISNVVGRRVRVAALREIKRVLRRCGRLYLFDSYAPALLALNDERIAAGMEPLPKARTGSVPLAPMEIFEALDMEVNSVPVALHYYVWTRYQFPFLNDGRFPETDEEREPPKDFCPHEAAGVQRLWVYEKV